MNARDFKKRRERCLMSQKLKKIIDEALKDFFKVTSRNNGRGTTYNVGDTDDLNKAKRLLKDWGIEYENLKNLNMDAPVLESLRLNMKGKVCVDAPDWFGRCDPEEVPPTILYVPEKLAIKMLTLGCLPTLEKAST